MDALSVLAIVSGIGKSGKPYKMVVVKNDCRFNKTIIKALEDAGVEIFDVTNNGNGDTE